MVIQWLENPMIDFTNGINTPEEEKVYQLALSLHPVVLNVGGMPVRLVVHWSQCHLVKDPEERRTRKMIFRDRAEMMANLPEEPGKTIVPDDCPCIDRADDPRCH
jgi:hypothetical protein